MVRHRLEEDGRHAKGGVEVGEEVEREEEEEEQENDGEDPNDKRQRRSTSCLKMEEWIFFKPEHQRGGGGTRTRGASI